MIILSLACMLMMMMMIPLKQQQRAKQVNKYNELSDPCYKMKFTQIDNAHLILSPELSIKAVNWFTNIKKI